MSLYAASVSAIQTGRDANATLQVLLSCLLPGLWACAGNGYLANVVPSEFAGVYEEELPVSISGKEWLAEHDEHWDSATQVPLMQVSVIKH